MYCAMDSAKKAAKNSQYNNMYHVSTSRAFLRELLSLPALVLLDLIALAVSVFAALMIRNYLLIPLFPGYFQPELLRNTFYNLWWFPLVFLFCLAYENLYSKRMPFWVELEYVLRAVTLAIIITVFFLFLGQIAAEISRSLLILSWLCLILFLPLLRRHGKILLVQAGIWNRKVLVVGTGFPARLIMQALAREKTMGYEVAGIMFEDENNWQSDQALENTLIPIVGSTDNLESITEESGIKDVIIAVPDLASPDLVNLTNRIQKVASNVFLAPDLFGLSLSGIEVQCFFEEQTLLLHIKNRLKLISNKVIKRMLDLLLSLVLAIGILPLISMIALVIKFDSPGPVFYCGERVGQNGKIFHCIKFRTMYLEAEQLLAGYLRDNKNALKEWDQFNKLITHDPRVTRFGAVLRRFSLDELPQIINIFLGQMSMVGPRPYLPAEREQMNAYYNDIIVAKPGLTGLWQVSGRSHVSFEGRLKLDVWYMRNWSPWLDFTLILRTMRVVLKADGAY